MKVVVAARLSQFGDGKTGLDSQEREVLIWARTHGHEIMGVALDFKSGKSDLWERPNLRKWVTEQDFLCQYDALVALKVDRLTRADDEGVDRLKKWARDNHKTIVITSADVRFPSEGMEGVRWDMYIRMAHQEWLDIRERYGRMQSVKHDAGSIVGRAPWGYEIIRLPDGRKMIEPTPDGREWVPKIFGWVAEGKTAAEVAEMLTDAKVRTSQGLTRWHEASVATMIKRPTYSGMRARKGRTALECEPLVSRALQDKAIAKLAARARLGPSGRTQPKALLAKLKCGHPDCPGEGDWPMYRAAGGKWYRCTGKGPQRKGCGNPMVPLEEADNLVLYASGYWDSKPYIAQRFVSGNDAGIRLERLRAEMAEAVRLAPADQIMDITTGYMERIAALEAEGSILPHWEDVETGETEGEHLRSLDLDGQREYLGRKDIKAWKDAEGRTCITIDGVLARTGGPTLIAEVADQNR